MGNTTLLAVGRSVVDAVKRDFRPVGTGSLPRFSKPEAGTANTGLFAATNAAKNTGTVGPEKPAGADATSPSLFTTARAQAKPRRSWFGWLLGGNRRRENGRLVQGELLLQNVRPVRNDLRHDDLTLVERRQSKVLYETPATAAARDDQSYAWNRLRGRKLENLVVKPD